MSIHDYNTICVSFSGGRTSAFMARYIQMRYGQTHRLLFIFANTGKEHEETLRFVHRCDVEWGLGVIWIEAHISQGERVGPRARIVDYESASRAGKPFEDSIRKYGIPNKAYPNCSERIKQQPIDWLCKQLSGGDPFAKAIGIRYDERHRIPTKRPRNFFYPLTEEIQITKSFILDWWKSQPFDLSLTEELGNCVLCWKKSLKKLKTIIDKDPSSIEWWKDMEAKYGHGMQSHFYRGNLPASQLEELAKTNFQPFQDPNLFAPRLFSEADLMAETDCFCKA